MTSTQKFTKGSATITLTITEDIYPDWAREVTAYKEFFKIFNWREVDD
jgi:hypothetical protein